MQKYLLFFSIAILVMLDVLGCTKQPANEVGMDKQFTLALGQTATVTGEDLSVKFVEVISDSRCPKGATCIWAGEASSVIEIRKSGSVYRNVLVQPGFSPSGNATFADYGITFNLDPYPEAGKQPSGKDYRLTLTFKKQPLLRGGILATFDVVGEKYSIFITNKQTIEQIFSLQRGESQARIPSGLLVRGAVSYNQPWSWHIDSEDIHMADFTIELCDGTPSQVEADLDYWLGTVMRFCPWGAKIVSVQDFR